METNAIATIEADGNGGMVCYLASRDEVAGYIADSQLEDADKGTFETFDANGDSLGHADTFAKCLALIYV